MTLQQIKQMQAARKLKVEEESLSFKWGNTGRRLAPMSSLKQREELRKQRNTHDPDDMYAWANNKPWWLIPLQVLGFVATGVGLTVCIYYATLILFLL
jgi:hypothetical protein